MNSQKLDVAVELRQLTKQFGECRANQGVNLLVKRGTIHGVIGENGAGKSTAMKMLYGLYQPDSGQILIHGKEKLFSSPQDAIEAGVGMVHQHFMLAEPYSALDNILMGAETSKKGFGFLPQFLRPIDRVRARARLVEISKQYGLDVDLDAPVEKLSVGIHQRIEILKLLYRNADILILDEPTAVLTPQEVVELFSNLRRLKSEGKTILIITHKLKEVMEFTDSVTVFRAGLVTGERETRNTNPQELADLMVGRKVLLKVDVPKQPALGACVLKMHDLQFGKKLTGATLEVRAGEVVGIAGIEGNGQSQILDAILNPGDPEILTQGQVEVLGHDAKGMTTAQIKDLGVGYIPEDRHRDGLLMGSRLDENFLLGLEKREGSSKHSRLLWRRIRAKAADAFKVYDVRPSQLHLSARGLSGGNQQKLIVAREFERKPKLLIAAQPTRGVDVGAIEFIHNRILEARTAGTGVLLISSELDEVLSLSDRVLVIYCGKIVAEYSRGGASEKEIGLKMAGGHA